MKKVKRVGIIGGMGSLASVDLYAKVVALTPAKKDQDHVLLTIDNNAAIPDRTEFIFGNGENPLPYLIDSANRLKNSGCKAITLACNTAHFFADDIAKACDVKILNIISLSVEAIKKNFPNAKNIAVIATTGTKKTGLYDKVLKENGFLSVELGEQNQEDIMKCIYDGVKAGKTAEYAPLFNQVIDSISADVFIAACTEIPILLPYLKKDVKFIDATEELAKGIVEFARA
ncbi:aspartate/glutamate racemase family protein [Campylobacter geochelonis]|uniref:aspartate/glutamate racemase family protein n=1 Tax=Campylobacter geochelonis TaxID=1780362 RepID=UPI00077070C1|nr:amino acid racemase [Campylobacter geochelonis]CZE48253.1 aspartate racemase [Campylobacter geochelonis]